VNKLEKIFNIKGKVVAITGGTGYLCGNLAEELLNLGCKVIVLDKNIKKSSIFISRLKNIDSDFAIYKIDVTKKKSFKNCLDKIIKKFKKIDILINGAGINAPTPILDISEKEWDDIFNTHLKGTFFGCQVFGKQMIAQKKGSIINFSSASANPPLSKAFAYSAAKSGIKNISQNIAREWAIYNIRVNCLRPGFFPTEWSKKKFLDKKRIKAILDHTPMQRFGEPIELLGAVIWLASDASSFVTGSEIAIDGGFSSMTI
jgi:NAD(P)-dependent dehydrogenase (short-subunit alcohol dehydrogenase family)